MNTHCIYKQKDLFQQSFCRAPGDFYCPYLHMSVSKFALEHFLIFVKQVIIRKN